MTKRILPTCSIPHCRHQSGAMIGDAFLCGEHATAALSVLIEQRQNVFLALAGDFQAGSGPTHKTL